MTTRPSSTRSTPPLPAMIATIAILALLVGGSAWHFLGSSSDSTSVHAITAQEQADMQFIKQKAKESNGDFDKLSKEDQRQLLSMHGAQAPFALRQVARELQHSQ